jgi:hypothetical protein
MFIILILGRTISLNLDYVPTVMNGIATSVSILVGFTATCIVIKGSYKCQKTTTQVWGLFFLVFPIILLFLGYANLLVNSEFEWSMRAVLLSFVFAIEMLFIVLLSMLKEHL